jgi:hypothetical protein
MEDSAAEIRSKREAAERARRLAKEFPARDRPRVLAYAEELEAEADALEREQPGKLGG